MRSKVLRTTKLGFKNGLLMHEVVSRGSFNGEITHKLRGHKVFGHDAVIAQEILPRMKYGVLRWRHWQRIRSVVLTMETESEANELKNGWNGTECMSGKCQTVGTYHGAQA